MRFFYSILFTAIAAIALTLFAYEPVSVALYRISEPYFRYPIQVSSGRIPIRHDAHGSGAFGAKRRNGRLHSGIDFQAPVGTPVRAAKSGRAFCLNVPTGYGKYVMIYHPDGYQTIYGHLSNWNVDSTEKVRAGDVIGFVGKTGNAASQTIQSHLHFEIRKRNIPQDPFELLK